MRSANSGSPDRCTTRLVNLSAFKLAVLPALSAAFSGTLAAVHGVRHTNLVSALEE